MQELILVAHFEELVTASLVVITEDVELRHSLLTFLAGPVVNFLMRTVRSCSIVSLAALEHLTVSALAMERINLLLCWTIEDGQRFG